MFSPVRILDSEAVIPDAFSGNLEIDRWLSRRFRHSIENKTAVFYGIKLTEHPDEIAGLYSLSSHSVQRSSLAPSRLRRNKPNDIPAVLLGILAVKQEYQHRQLGSSLLHHSITTAQALTGLIGAKIMVVDPIDARVAEFYKHYGFRPLSPTTQRLYIPL